MIYKLLLLLSILSICYARPRRRFTFLDEYTEEGKEELKRVLRSHYDKHSSKEWSDDSEEYKVRKSHGQPKHYDKHSSKEWSDVSEEYKVKKSHDEPKFEDRDYQFRYQVDDDSEEVHFGHKEAKSSGEVEGYYYVLLPDSRLQHVKYVADDDSGYVAEVTYVESDSKEKSDEPSNEKKHHQESSEDSREYKNQFKIHSSNKGHTIHSINTENIEHTSHESHEDKASHNDHSAINGFSDHGFFSGSKAHGPQGGHNSQSETSGYFFHDSKGESDSQKSRSNSDGLGIGYGIPDFETVPVENVKTLDLSSHFESESSAKHSSDSKSHGSHGFSLSSGTEADTSAYIGSHGGHISDVQNGDDLNQNSDIVSSKSDLNEHQNFGVSLDEANRAVANGQQNFGVSLDEANTAVVHESQIFGESLEEANEGAAHENQKFGLSLEEANEAITNSFPKTLDVSHIDDASNSHGTSHALNDFISGSHYSSHNTESGNEGHVSHGSENVKDLHGSQGVNSDSHNDNGLTTGHSADVGSHPAKISAENSGLHSDLSSDNAASKDEMHLSHSSISDSNVHDLEKVGVSLEEANKAMSHESHNGALDVSQGSQGFDIRSTGDSSVTVEGGGHIVQDSQTGSNMDDIHSSVDSGSAGHEFNIGGTTHEGQGTNNFEMKNEGQVNHDIKSNENVHSSHGDQISNDAGKSHIDQNFETGNQGGHASDDNKNLGSKIATETYVIHSIDSGGKSNGFENAGESHGSNIGLENVEESHGSPTDSINSHFVSEGSIDQNLDTASNGGQSSKDKMHLGQGLDSGTDGHGPQKFGLSLEEANKAVSSGSHNLGLVDSHGKNDHGSNTGSIKDFSIDNVSGKQVDHSFTEIQESNKAGSQVVDDSAPGGERHEIYSTPSESNQNTHGHEKAVEVHENLERHNSNGKGESTGHFSEIRSYKEHISDNGVTGNAGHISPDNTGSKSEIHTIFDSSSDANLHGNQNVGLSLEEANKALSHISGSDVLSHENNNQNFETTNIEEQSTGVENEGSKQAVHRSHGIDSQNNEHTGVGLADLNLSHQITTGNNYHDASEGKGSHIADDGSNVHVGDITNTEISINGGHDSGSVTEENLTHDNGHKNNNDYTSHGGSVEHTSHGTASGDQEHVNHASHSQSEGTNTFDHGSEGLVDHGLIESNKDQSIDDGTVGHATGNHMTESQISESEGKESHGLGIIAESLGIQGSHSSTDGHGSDAGSHHKEHISGEGSGGLGNHLNSDIIEHDFRGSATRGEIPESHHYEYVNRGRTCHCYRFGGKAPKGRENHTFNSVSENHSNNILNNVDNAHESNIGQSSDDATSEHVSHTSEMGSTSQLGHATNIGSDGHNNHDSTSNDKSHGSLKDHSLVQENIDTGHASDSGTQEIISNKENGGQSSHGSEIGNHGDHISDNESGAHSPHVSSVGVEMHESQSSDSTGSDGLESHDSSKVSNQNIHITHEENESSGHASDIKSHTNDPISNDEGKGQGHVFKIGSHGDHSSNDQRDGHANQETGNIAEAKESHKGDMSNNEHGINEAHVSDTKSDVTSSHSIDDKIKVQADATSKTTSESFISSGHEGHSSHNSDTGAESNINDGSHSFKDKSENHAHETHGSRGSEGHIESSSGGQNIKIDHIMDSGSIKHVDQGFKGSVELDGDQGSSISKGENILHVSDSKKVSHGTEMMDEVHLKHGSETHVISMSDLLNVAREILNTMMVKESHMDQGMQSVSSTHKEHQTGGSDSSANVDSSQKVGLSLEEANRAVSLASQNAGHGVTLHGSDAGSHDVPKTDDGSLSQNHHVSKNGGEMHGSHSSTDKNGDHVTHSTTENNKSHNKHEINNGQASQVFNFHDFLLQNFGENEKSTNPNDQKKQASDAVTLEQERIDIQFLELLGLLAKSENQDSNKGQPVGVHL